jgi:hypothetical protein
MWLVILTVVGVVSTGAPAIRSLRHWLVLRRLPVVSGASFLAVKPGTAVILTGRTASGPLLAAPRSGRECVHHQTIHIHEYHYSGEGSEITERIGPGVGDNRLHGEAGIAVDVDVAVGRRKLFVAAPALLISFYPRRPEFIDRPGDEYYERELITPPGLRVFAAGMVSAGGERLEPYGPVIGSAIGDVTELGSRFHTEIAWFGGSTLVLTGALILLLLR